MRSDEVRGWCWNQIRPEVAVERSKCVRIGGGEPETDVAIPQRAMVKFKAGKEMRADVMKLSPKHSPQLAAK